MSTREQGGLNIDRIRSTKLSGLRIPLRRNLGVFSLAWGFRCAASLTSGGPEPVRFAHWAPSPFPLPPSFHFTFTFTPFVSFHQLAHWIWVIRFTEAEAEAERPLSGHPTRPTAPSVISYQSIASGSRPIQVPFRTYLL